MKRSSRLLKLFVMLTAFSMGAEYALAQLPGPFNFSFATGFLNSLFLAPLRLGGCAGF